MLRFGKKISDDDIKNIVSLLELVLLGQLVRATGFIWYVDSDICNLDFRFACRWGDERDEVLGIYFDVRDIKRLIETQMEHECADIVSHYIRRTR